jgi:hypothetical protein
MSGFFLNEIWRLYIVFKTHFKSWTKKRIQIPYIFHREYDYPVVLDRLRIRLYNKVGEFPLQTDFSILFSAEKSL